MAMEAALVSVATGVLKPVLGKLTVLLGNEYKRFKTVRKEIKSLTHELAAMEAFLLKMCEVEDPDPQDKVWMNEVRELSYDMEDAIDDFMQSVGDKDEKPDGFIEKIKSSLGKLGKMKARRRIGREIQDLKKQIIEVSERNARYKTRQAFSNTINATVDPRALVIFEHASKLVGIDRPKAEIIKLLTEDDGCASAKQDEIIKPLTIHDVHALLPENKDVHAVAQQPPPQPPKVVSIVGSGGMGKTTLANQVYQELKGQYTCCAFVSVSRNPDKMNILRTIYSQVSCKSYDTTEAGSIQHIITNIKESLANKRYFVVVDDIWDVDTWDVIKHAFPYTSPKDRSIIITTTRKNDVGDSCRSSFNGHIYYISPLAMVYSRQLFHRRIFGSERNCPSYLQKVSTQILERCDGLPLAIIAISGLLANKERTHDQWNKVKDSIGHALERSTGVEGMMQIISLSYFDLPPHLKSCLLYLSIFPEDFIIERKGLIRRWIAEGFIHIEGRHTIGEFGNICFNELVNRSLIQPVKTNKYGKVKSCRVHDTILYFIISKSIEENFVTLVGIPNITFGTQGKVRRLSLQGSKHGNSVLPTRVALSHVRSLNVFARSAEIPSLDEFRHLRVLDFERCLRLENHHLVNIGRLLQLRYLNLRRTNISELSEQIINLQCLEMLDLRGTAIRELPSTIFNIRKLVKLFVDNHIQFLDGIAKMQQLEILELVITFNLSLNFLQELGQLKNLRKMSLDLHDVCGRAATFQKCREAIASCLQILGTQNLRSLIIENADCFLLEQWNPAPVSLRKLMTYNSPFPRVPSWVCSLINLQKLQLEVEQVVQQDLRNLGSLPALLVLNLTVQTKSKDWLIVSDGVGFQCLAVFCYHIGQLGGMDLMFAAGSMPTLEKLEIEFNAAESDSIGADAFDFGIKNLPCLTTLTCITRGWLESAVSAAKAAMEETAKAHPNHPTLLLA